MWRPQGLWDSLSRLDLPPPIASHLRLGSAWHVLSDTSQSSDQRDQWRRRKGHPPPLLFPPACTFQHMLLETDCVVKYRVQISRPGCECFPKNPPPTILTDVREPRFHPAVLSIHTMFIRLVEVDGTF